MDMYITESDLFDRHRRDASSVVNFDNRLPDRVFSPGFEYFTFIHFDDIFTEEFYTKIGAFLKQTDENEFTVLVLEPDPRSYFYNHFGKYPLIRVPSHYSPKEYVSAVFEDPGGSSADAIGYNSAVAAIFSTSLRWAIYGSRDFEVGIFASRDKTLLDAFQRSYKRTFDVSLAIENILEPAWRNKFPIDFKTKLLANYS